MGQVPGVANRPVPGARLRARRAGVAAILADATTAEQGMLDIRVADPPGSCAVRVEAEAHAPLEAEVALPADQATGVTFT